MYPDDVFRQRLDEVIGALEAWGAQNRDCASVEIAQAPTYWKLSVRPNMPGAATFDILLQATQRFSLAVAGEVYEDKTIDRFDFFPMLVRAIAEGHAERIETRSALTGALEVIETRIELEDGWAWIGERRVTPRSARKIDSAQEIRKRRYLPYRR